MCIFLKNAGSLQFGRRLFRGGKSCCLSLKQRSSVRVVKTPARVSPPKSSTTSFLRIGNCFSLRNVQHADDEELLSELLSVFPVALAVLQVAVIPEYCKNIWTFPAEFILSCSLVCFSEPAKKEKQVSGRNIPQLALRRTTLAKREWKMCVFLIAQLGTKIRIESDRWYL